MAETPSTGYPLRFDVDYPDRELNRLTTFFRIFMLIPIAIVLGALGGGWNYSQYDSGEVRNVAIGSGGLVFLPTLLLIVFRQKYPRWWYDWNLQLTRFANRVGAYALLLRDEYPSTDDEQAVHFEMPYPDASRDINRYLPLVKWLLAIPHYIVLFFLAIATFVVVVIAWFAILFTGRYPRGLFDFVVGVVRWANRVEAYAITLVTDVYPPFRLGA
jgi:hypothetical protein